MGVIKECGGKMWMGERLLSVSHLEYSIKASNFQVNGTEQAKISLSLSAITMKLGHLNEFKCSSTSSWQICLLVARSIHSTVKRLNRAPSL